MKKSFSLQTSRGQRFEIQLTESLSGLEIAVNGKVFHYPRQGHGTAAERFSNEQQVPLREGNEAGMLTILSPMPGVVQTIHVVSGQSVHKDTTLLVLSAMKMENEITASGEGQVERVLVSPGETVQAGQPLMVLRKSS